MNPIVAHDCTGKNNSILVTDDLKGEIFCGRCGVILKDKIVDRTNELKLFSKEEFFTKTRTGAPLKDSMFDKGLSSVIGTNKDSSGKEISPASKFHFSRLRVWDSRSKKTSKEKSLDKAFTILDSIITKLSLPENVREHSAQIFRKASKNNIIQGNSVNSTIAATVYASCKELGIPRSLYEIAKTVNISRKTLSHTYKRLFWKLNLDVYSQKVDYVSKVANSVGADEKTKRLSSQILEDAKKEKIHVGKNPIGLAAGAVYLSGIGTGKNISMRKIARKSNISIVTIRKITQMLRPFGAKYIETIAGKS